MIAPRDGEGLPHLVQLTTEEHDVRRL